MCTTAVAVCDAAAPTKQPRSYRMQALYEQAPCGYLRLLFVLIVQVYTRYTRIQQAAREHSPCQL